MKIIRQITITIQQENILISQEIRYWKIQRYQYNRFTWNRSYISFFSTLKDTYKEEEVEIDKEIPVYAHSRTIINVAYTVVTTDYKIVKKADANTKAGEEILASMKVKNFATALGDILVDQQIPGHNHAPAGHGHGHGHGGDNAGGGIVVAD